MSVGRAESVFSNSNQLEMSEELILTNNDGQCTFTHLYVDLSAFPRKLNQQEEGGSLTSTTSLRSESQQSTDKLMPKENKCKLDFCFNFKFSVCIHQFYSPLLDNCVIIAEDASRPFIFGRKIKSHFVECTLQVKSTEIHSILKK
jgi:hypothetical protein